MPVQQPLAGMLIAVAGQLQQRVGLRTVLSHVADLPYDKTYGTARKVTQFRSPGRRSSPNLRIQRICGKRLARIDSGKRRSIRRGPPTGQGAASAATGRRCWRRAAKIAGHPARQRRTISQNCLAKSEMRLKSPLATALGSTKADPTPRQHATALRKFSAVFKSTPPVGMRRI